MFSKLPAIGFLFVASLVQAATPSSAQTWKNPECAKGPCALRSASLTTYKFGTSNAMVANFTTSKISQLSDYVFVQFIRGCSFMEDAQGNKSLVTRVYEGRSDAPFDHVDWQIDENAYDPVYWGVKEGFDPLRGRMIPRNAKYSVANPMTGENSIWYGNPGAITKQPPTLYITDQPTGGSHDPAPQMGVPSLEFQTCLYRAQDVPTSLAAVDQPIPNALHCFGWQSNYSYNWQTKTYSEAKEIDPFCGVK